MYVQKEKERHTQTDADISKLMLVNLYNILAISDMSVMSEVKNFGGGGAKCF